MTEPTEPNLTELAARLGLVADAPHFVQALTHPSYANERIVFDRERDLRS